jgi:hypothetical protein
LAAFTLAARSSSSFFSGVGQMPSCSYRSKKLELVGGDRKLILVDRDRGSSLCPDALRDMSLEPSGCEMGAGTGGRGALGAGDIGTAEEGEGGRGNEVTILRDDGVDSLDGTEGVLVGKGKYGGLGGRSGGLSTGAEVLLRASECRID